MRPTLARSLFTALLLVTLWAAPGPVAADTLEDLLWEFQVAPLDRTPAPPVALEALHGGTVSLAGLRGRAVVLYFWHSA